MATDNQKISQMPAASTVTAADVVPILQGGLNKTSTFQVIVNFFATLFASLASANVFTNQQAVTPYRAAIAGAVTIDLAATGKSNNLHLTLSANVTSFALSNPVDGAVYNIRIYHSASGYTFSGLSAAFKFAGGTVPTWSTAANSVDFISAEWGATEATYMAAALIGVA